MLLTVSKMMTTVKCSILFTALAALLLWPHPLSLANGKSSVLDPGLDQSERWNRFAEAVYVLHERQVEGRRIETSEEIGSYGGYPKFYREVRYSDSASHRLLSRIRWESKYANRVHQIEVFVYDDEGRVLRDYAAIYLPDGRHAPVVTLINLHRYHEGLHAFRQFDASRNKIYENCEGNYQSKKLSIDLDEDDLLDAEDDPEGIFFTEAYRACFDGLPETVGGYLQPQ